MNKLFTKIASLALGAAMAFGVGVAVSGQAKASAVEATDANVVIADLGWGSGSTNAKGESNAVTIDTNTKFYFTGGGNVGKYYTSSPAGARMYQTDSDQIHVVALNGVSLTSIKFTYAVKNGGILHTSKTTGATAAYPSGQAVSLSSVSSVTAHVANSGSATNGQVAIQRIDVSYSAGTTTATTTTVETKDSASATINLSGSVELVSSVTYGSGTAVPSATVTYGSSDTNIATVNSSGVVTASSTNTGDVVITASYAGNSTYAASSGNITITVVDPDAEEFELVTSTSGIVSGKDYLIGHASSKRFMAGQDTNLRLSVAGVVVNNKVSYVNTMERFTIEDSGTVSSVATYSLKATNLNQGYLYASSSSDNRLKTESELDNNGRWAITISSGEASIIAKGSSSRNVMQFNSAEGQLKFNCYASASQSNVSLWKKVGADKLASPEPVFDDANRQITWDAISGASSYELKVDSGSYGVATSPYSVSGLSEGNHTVYVVAKGDGTNYSDSDAGTVNFTISTPTTIDHVDVSGAPSGTITNATVGQTLPLEASATNSTGSGTSTFSWTSSNEAVATVSGGTVTYVGDGTATITATSNYPAATGKSNAGTASITISGLKGTATNPLSVAEARGIAQTASSATAQKYYATGIISSIPEQTWSSQYGNKTFNISANGSATDELEAYRCLYLNGEKMSEAEFNSVEVGDTVIVYGSLQNYNSTLEFVQGCYITSHVKPVLSEYTVTYNANGGSCATPSESVASGGHPTFPTATKSGYTFDGWQEGGSGTYYTSENANSYTVSHNVTFVAHYTENVEPTGDTLIITPDYLGVDTTGFSSETELEATDGKTYVAAAGGSNTVKKSAGIGDKAYDTSSKALQIGKRYAYFYNSDPLDHPIASFKIYNNSSASTNVNVAVEFATASDGAITDSIQSSTNTEQLNAANTRDFDLSYEDMSSDYVYFRLEVLNAYNATIQIEITYKSSTPTSSVFISGPVDENNNFFVDDYGYAVLSCPTGYPYFGYVTTEHYLITFDNITHPTSGQARASFETEANTGSDTITFYFYESMGQSGVYGEYTTVEEEITLINPTGLSAAISYAGLLVSSCDAGTQESDWSTLSSMYSELGAEAKAYLKNASFSLVGQEIVKDPETHYDVAQGMSVYDKIVNVYHLTNFMDRETSNAYITGSGRIDTLPSITSDSATIAIVVISVIGLSAVGGYFFLRKRKEA